MSIIKWFNKPKWQSPNEQVRITAIQSGTDPELQQSLPDIINTDVSLKVQKTALAKVDDPAIWCDVLHQHSNPEIRKQASKRLTQWFSQYDTQQQDQLVTQVTDADTLKALAQVAMRTAVRRHALGFIKQPGLLGELLFTEQDAALQQLIIDKIEQPSTLERLLKKTTKKQQQLRTLIEHKLSDHLEVDADQQAQQLCQALEAVVHGKHRKDINLQHIKQQWQAIASRLPEAMKLRFNGSYEAARMILDPEHRNQFLQKQKQQRQLALINDLEQQLTDSQALSLQQVQQALEKYQAIELVGLKESDQLRYKSAFEQLLKVRDQIQETQQIPAAATQVIDQMNQLLKQQIAQPNQLNKQKQQWSKATAKTNPSEALSQLQTQFKDLCLRLAEKIEQSGTLRDQAAQSAVDLLEPVLAQIKDGQLAKAKVTINKIANHKNTAGHNHPVIKRNKYQFDSAWQQLKDLRNWQKWSNDKARRSIIDELHDMIGKGLHPDAVLKKLKDSNERWYALEDMEKLDGDRYPSRNQKMWQEFRDVSKTLFEPTQPFFEKRSEQQDGFLTVIQQNIEEMEQMDLGSAEEKTLARVSREGIKHLKSLDKLPPKQRGITAKRLRKAINRIDQKLNEFYSVAENRKHKLISEAQALADMEDLPSAIEAAKQLQQRWKNAGVVKQYTERKLWKKFRQANDAVFNRRQQEQKQQNDAYQAQKQQAQKLLADFKKKLDQSKDLEQLKTLKTALTHDWQALEKPDNFPQHEYNHLLQNIKDKSQQIEFKTVLNELKQKQQLDDIYSQLEQQQITEAEASKQAEKLLTKELRDFFQTRETANSTETSLADMLIRAEFTTGLETPEPYVDERMAYQVKVLSARMSGEKVPNNQEQALQWLDDWFLSPKTDAEFMQQNKQRIKQAIKAMRELVTQ